MAPGDPQPSHSEAWRLAARQHGVISEAQLRQLGFGREAIRHRLAKGRLHRVHRGVYAVGRPQLSREGEWMAAVLRCGPGAALSHESAGQHLRIRPGRRHHAPIEISVFACRDPRPEGIRVHRRANLRPEDIISLQGIPLTSPIRTLIDLAAIVPSNQLEAAVNEADKLDLVDPETLRTALEELSGQPGVVALRTLLDRDTFRLTESELERRFLRIVRKVGLPLPETQFQLNGRVDFHWPKLGLVIETDGLRYHRTPTQQAKDNRRMQGHAAAGRTAIRISHYEIRYEADRVAGVVRGLIRSLKPPAGD